MMRHAKSSWKDSSLRDFDRPLNKRGKNDAPLMGRFLLQQNLLPEQIFSSPAVRAKATILNVIRELDLPESTIIWDENLYYDGAESYFNAIRNAHNQSEIVMTVGHNPMTEDAISAMAGNSIDKRIKTATIACFEFEADSWHQIEFGAHALRWIRSPVDLK